MRIFLAAVAWASDFFATHHLPPTIEMNIASFLLLPALLTITHAAEVPDDAALRRQALQFIQPLPDRMPGAEKDTAAQISLGRELFFDKRLSKNHTQSCNSCHAVDAGRGGVDNEATSPGAFGKRGDRNSPTVLNAGFHVAQFWDGRAGTLEDQAKGPILNPVEMAMPDAGEVIARLNAVEAYKTAFAAAFPGTDNPISYDNVARAIAAFERTLKTSDRFDDFLKGEGHALTPDEKSGLHLFLTVGCTTCHLGPTMGGNLYQKMGLLKPYKNDKDLGRAALTRNDAEKFFFKVPSLRNVALTHPYFHDGGAAELEDAVGTMAEIQLGKTLTYEEKRKIATFLYSLSDKDRAAAAAQKGKTAAADKR
ncbi:MAG: c-type cytochrome [Verrucomicrobiales bacterium]|nr:c-type cytochrome [Verrucomicrobiales bacterium]